MPRQKFENEYTYKRMLESGSEDEFDRLFDKAAEEARDGFGAEHPIYIAGRQVRAEQLLIEKSPIDAQIVIGKFQKGTREHARLAIDAARKAFETWSITDYRKRASIIRKAADLFSRDKYSLAAILSYENAKSRYESVGEVDEAIDFMRYYADELEANKGFIRKTALKASTSKVAAGFQGAPGSQERVTISLRPYGV
ncbi:MAG: aldehyde dehydrogenase family protein, partial [Candidatus Micrarchaeaceae archaeon]